MEETRVDSRTSWKTAWLVLAILSVSYGSPLLIVVGMKPIQESLGIERSVVALAGALVWVGTGAGGIFMGWLADRIGIRRTVMIGGCMIAGGLALSSLGSIWALYVGHGLMIGLLGNGGVYPPLLVYVSRWFERRRGAAIALISSGQYVAGVLWPSLFERGLAADRLADADAGLRRRRAGAARAGDLPPEAAAACRHRCRGRCAPARARAIASPDCIPNVVQALICVAGFCCCIPMSVPSAHIVAFCGDIGIKPTHGAAMLSVMLGCAFLARQLWGALADRIGGLRTVMVGSSCQAVAIACFLLTQDEAGLFVDRGGLRLRLQRHHPVLQRGDPRALSVGRSVVAHAAHPVHRHERHGVRQPGSPARSTTTSATTRRPSASAWCSTSST